MKSEAAEVAMALSDACYEFLQAVVEASRELARRAHEYADPGGGFDYGPEVDALRRAAVRFAEHPYDREAGARLLRLAAVVGAALDTPPGTDESKILDTEVRRLIRLMEDELLGDAESVEGVIENVVQETRYTPQAAKRLRELLPKLGKTTYDLAVKVIGDVASAATKKMLGM